MVSRFPPTLFNTRFSATPDHRPMIPETNPAAKPKQVKINGKQPNHPHPVSEKNAGGVQGEFAVKEGERNEDFRKNCGVFLIYNTYILNNLLLNG